MWDNSTLQSFLTFNVIHEVQQHCGYQSNYKKVEGKPMQKRHNQQWHSQVSNKTLKKKRETKRHKSTDHKCKRKKTLPEPGTLCCRGSPLPLWK